jgi:orotidine-5'-phosphate decarboxylase
MTFLEKIRSSQERANSVLCVGLDTDHRNLPDVLKNEANPVLAFNLAIIEATKDLACAYKPNACFYEAYGAKGFETLEKTVAAIPNHILTIADVKRGDLSSSSEQYAYAYQKLIPFDSVTLSPYMGYDSVEPFLQSEDQGVFFLGVTSNKSARDFQHLELANGKKLYEQVTDTVRDWNTKNNCGLVVGATKPEELAALRSRAPELPFLVPGVGAQGGSVQDALRANGEGLILINVSRGITAASKGSDFAEAARRAAEKIIEEMRVAVA